MKIDGRTLADQIYSHLPEVPAAAKLLIIQIGSDVNSNAYIRQKQKTCDMLGIHILIKKFETPQSIENINTVIGQSNTDDSIHAMILQQPVPSGFLIGNPQELLTVAPEKDVDGFVPGSHFQVPVVQAVREILKQTQFHKDMHIAVIGKGVTAGKPIYAFFQRQGYTVTLIDSHTRDPERVTRSADVVISAVGKPNIVRRDSIKRGVILISIGMHRDGSGKLHGDYNEAEIADIASWYTPTPGGVGPVNIACLMKNIIFASLNNVRRN